jgi:hypothetical protein
VAIAVAAALYFVVALRIFFATPRGYDAATQVVLGLLFVGAAVLCGALSFVSLNRTGLVPTALWGNVTATAFFAPMIGLAIVLYVYAS